MSSLDELMGVAAPAAPAAAAAAGGSAPAAAAPAAAQSVFLSRLFGQLVQSTRLANALPDADDFKFNATASPEFAQQAAATQKQLLSLMGLLSDAVRFPRESSVSHNARSGVSTPGVLPASTSLTSLGDSLDRFNAVVDTCDTALEQVDLLLDQHRGVTRGGVAGAGAQVALVDARGRNAQVNSSHTMMKPQRNFAHLIDNTTQPWIPLLTDKPNALTPLPDYVQMRKEKMGKTGAAASAASGSSSISAMDEGASPVAKDPLFPHPYKHEIESLTFDENPAQLQAGKEQLYGSLASVPCTWVDTPAALAALASELESASEIAIDLEHHSWRSYLGLTCLMQISTRRADWLVDTLALRGELQRLNKAFTDPSIVKVLHGADSDVVWLQRDLGLYIVNLFDTGQAARVLELPKYSLAYLLSHFCDVTADKKYQLADWRIRPLSAEMLLYARMDTHYLLYIYDRLRNQLITRSTAAQNQLSPIRNCAYLLAQTLERSRQISLKTFEKESVAGVEASAAEFAYKSGLSSNDPTTAALVALFRVRDEVARVEDESPFFLCNNQDLFNIAQQQPTTQQQLVACCRRPTPPLIRDNAAKVIAALQEAAKSKSGPTSATSGSPALRSSSADASSVPDMHQTPLSNKATSFTIGLPTVVGLTPATATSLLFSQLATSTPQQQQQPGWMAQNLIDEGMTMHPVQQSPVMSTEQLYSSANWTLAGKQLERGIAAQRQGGQTQPLLTTGSLSIPLFDLSGSDPHSSPMQRSRNASGSGSTLTALLSPAPKHSTFSMLSNPVEMKSDATHQAAFAEARASLLAAGPIHPPSAPLPQVSSTPLKSITPSVEEESSLLRTPLTGEPRLSFTSPSPMSLQIIPSPLTVPASSSQFSSIAGQVVPAAVVPAAAAAAADSTLPASAAPSPLPSSMREIFKISNDNRRKKKRAKLTHELGGAAAAGATGAGWGDDDEHGGIGPPITLERKKGSYQLASPLDVAADGTTSVDFMKHIGWGTGAQLDAAAAIAPQHSTNHQQPSSANQLDSAKKRRRSGSASAPSASLSSSPPAVSSLLPTAAAAAPSVVQPFDYSMVSLPPSAPAAHAHFQPYADMGRDAGELRAASRDPNAPRFNDPAHRIYKGHTMLKNASKSVTVKMDDAHQHRGRGGAIPIPARNQQQQQQQRR